MDVQTFRGRLCGVGWKGLQEYTVMAILVVSRVGKLSRLAADRFWKMGFGEVKGDLHV